MNKSKKHTVKCSLLLAIALVSYNISVSQNNASLDSLLLCIYKTDSSKQIPASKPGLLVIGYGYKLLSILATKFNDTTVTNIQSDCKGNYLTRGDVCIILADHIEMMPYALLTGVQNCTLQFCGPNFIEMYLPHIHDKGITNFSTKYIEWLKSADRRKWTPYIQNKKKKTI